MKHISFLHIWKIPDSLWILQKIVFRVEMQLYTGLHGGSKQGFQLIMHSQPWEVLWLPGSGVIHHCLGRGGPASLLFLYPMPAFISKPKDAKFLAYQFALKCCFPPKARDTVSGNRTCSAFRSIILVTF